MSLGNPKAIGSKCVFASYRIPGSRFRGDDGNRRLETDILKLTTLPRAIARELGIHRETAKKYALADSPPVRRTATATLAQQPDRVPTA